MTILPHWALRLVPVALALLLHDPTAQAAADAKEPARYEQIKPSRDGIGKVYMGREIAAIMGWQAAGWLERPEREREEGSDRLIQRLELKPGMVIADIGAGTGYYSRRFSSAVRPGGVVYAVEVQSEMLRLLTSLAKDPAHTNIRPVLGVADDARLPASSVDLAILIDVYHELEYPYEVLASVIRALKPDGRVAFVEYRAEDPTVPIKPLHKMSIVQVRREAQGHGLVLDDSIRGLPWQHVLLFRRPESAGDPGPGSDR
ncbi:MAG: class I SAM-dependent methyltransferase [Panacagrimonas sp.]